MFYLVKGYELFFLTVLLQGACILEGAELLKRKYFKEYVRIATYLREENKVVRENKRNSSCCSMRLL